MLSLSFRLALVSFVLVESTNPHDFRVSVENPLTVPKISGYLNREGRPTAPVRATVLIHDCGRLDVFGHHSLEFRQDDTRASLDVSDMVSSGRLADLQGFCIGFTAALRRSVDSIAYLIPPEGDATLILSPSNVAELAHEGHIQYTTVNERGMVLGQSMFNGMDIEDVGTFSPTRIDPTGTSRSTVSLEAFEFLTEAIIEARGRLLEVSGKWKVYLRHGNTCGQMREALPDLYYLLSNDGSSGNTRIIFTPEDYLLETSERNACTLDIDPHFESVISGGLARLIGGYHFDYSGNRLGIFDTQ